MAFILSNRFEDALAVLERGLAKHPTSHNLLSNRAIVLVRNPHLPGVVSWMKLKVSECILIPPNRTVWTVCVPRQ